MKQFLLSVILLFSLISSAQNLYQNLEDGSAGITNGYGAWGTYNYTREASIDVPDKGTITFYHPDMAAPQQRPVIFYISGWGRTYETYDKFFKYIASLGYVVVNIYNTRPGSINTSYQNSLDMMQQAVNTYSNWIDTSKVGLMGHSYGGGSTIWLGKQVFDSNGLNWGADGRFIMTFAQWLSFKVTDVDLQNYPPNVKLLMLQSYDDLHSGGPNYNTDPRALRAVYQLINIPDNDKDFITAFSDTDPAHEYLYNGNAYSYKASHFSCYTSTTDSDGHYQPFDAQDAYLSNRLADAMIKYVFEDDSNAQRVALGNGSHVQKDMGIMPDLAVSDYYVTNRPESVFEYKCSATTGWGDTGIWHLQNYCTDSDGDGHIDTLSARENLADSFAVYPNPVAHQIFIDPKNNEDYLLTIQNTSGQIIYQNKLSATANIDISKWSKGIYFVKIMQQSGEMVKRIVKE
jgi:acetyl esterase/lipase